MTRVATICFVVTCLLNVACVPDPLDGFADMGMPSNNPNAMPGDTDVTPDTGNPVGNFNPEFLAVTAILRPNCLAAGCHGMGSGAVFTVPTGTNATDMEIQTALSSSIPTSTGNRLITASDPTTSEIYLRITKPPGDAQLMGAGTYGALATPLLPAQVTAIQTWITNGAIYTQ